MQLIEQSHEILNISVEDTGVLKQIEKVGRVCYKSEEKINDLSAIPFVEKLIKNGHGGNAGIHGYYR